MPLKTMNERPKFRVQKASATAASWVKPAAPETRSHAGYLIIGQVRTFSPLPANLDECTQRRRCEPVRIVEPRSGEFRPKVGQDWDKGSKP